MTLFACPECHQQVSTEALSCPHCGKVLSPLAAVPAGGLPAGAPFAAAALVPEQTLWEGRPSAALLYGKIARVVIALAVLSTLAYLAMAIGIPRIASMSSNARLFVERNAGAFRLGILLALAVSLLPPVIDLLLAIARIKSTHYRVTNQRILIESGIFAKSLEDIDMRSVDDVEFHQSFAERILGVGEISIVSSDKVAPRLVLIGISDPRNTRELIRANAYQASQRQFFTRST